MKQHWQERRLLTSQRNEYTAEPWGLPRQRSISPCLPIEWCSPPVADVTRAVRLQVPNCVGGRVT